MRRWDVYVTCRAAGSLDGRVTRRLAAQGYYADTAWQAAGSVLFQPEQARLRGDSFISIEAYPHVRKEQSDG